MSLTETQRELITSYNRNQINMYQSVSQVELPSIFAIYRHDVPDQREPSEESHWVAALVTAERCSNTRTQWRFTMVRNPVDMIGAASVYTERNDHWLGGRIHEVFVQKLSTDINEHGRLVHTRVRFNNVVISIPGAAQQIPCLDVSDALQILPHQFRDLTSNRVVHYRLYLRPTEPIIRHWENVMGGVSMRDPAAILERIDQRIVQRAQAIVDGVATDILAPSASRNGGFFQRLATRQQQREGQPIQVRVPTPQPTAPPAPHTISPPTRVIQAQAQPTMPQHIANAYIDSLIASGTLCPIAQEPLTRDTACLTPCGHVYSFDEVARWIQGGHSCCPECRASCSVAQLQRWRVGSGAQGLP
jgi:hypothetical protein